MMALPLRLPTIHLITGLNQGREQLQTPLLSQKKIKNIIDMSRSTRRTPAMLEAMGLIEVPPGVYEKATNKYVAGVDPVSEDHVESYFAAMETESDGSKKLMRSINNPDPIQEMRDMAKHY